MQWVSISLVGVELFMMHKVCDVCSHIGEFVFLLEMIQGLSHTMTEAREEVIRCNGVLKTRKVYSKKQSNTGCGAVI